ncbi:MAG TPA: hypothetical protein PK263_02880 [bacterium]|nr:hypothetical protein [bacterium]
MRYKVCDKCGEVVAKTGFISSNEHASKQGVRFAKCNNKECRKYFPQVEYEKLKEIDF